MSSADAAPRAVVLVSNARAEASRKNGARSRGPKTSEGKARSAQNALKHGMRAAKHLVLPDEDAAEFAELETALLAELAPVGALQAVLARRVAAAVWRLARADRIEADLFEERWLADGGPGIALIRDGNGTRSFETLLRYRSAAMAELMRALRTLKALQAEQQTTAMAASPPRPKIAQRNTPDEPKRAAGARPEYVTPDPPAPARSLHEAAAPWLPNEPGPGRDRQLEHALPELPAPGRALHETAAPWPPNAPEAGPGRTGGTARGGLSSSPAGQGHPRPNEPNSRSKREMPSR